MTLVILAAGMASRYGGNKQIDPVTGNGEFIIDFSVYDAARAGFDKIVFVIKRENLEVFEATIGSRAGRRVRVEYAFQELNALPAGFVCPDGRTKPWGTAHALMAAEAAVAGDRFAVINADDFYGADAFEKLAAHLRNAVEGEYCMVGYVLRNTLTEHGTVSRGICGVNNAGFLTSITERTKLGFTDGGAAYFEDGEWHPVPADAMVSMNCWGCTPGAFAMMKLGFADFLKKNIENPTCEYYLPYAIREIMEAGRCTVRALPTDAKWYGVTYKDDKPAVVAAVRGLIDAGVYPEKLFD